jgi:pilus assembly protein Flp/PilA
MTIIARTLRDDSGASAIEFGLLATLVSVAAVAGFSTIGEALNAMFTQVAGVIEEALAI